MSLFCPCACKGKQELKREVVPNCLLEIVGKSGSQNVCESHQAYPLCTHSSLEEVPGANATTELLCFQPPPLLSRAYEVAWPPLGPVPFLTLGPLAGWIGAEGGQWGSETHARIWGSLGWTWKNIAPLPHKHSSSPQLLCFRVDDVCRRELV